MLSPNNDNKFSAWSLALKAQDVFQDNGRSRVRLIFTTTNSNDAQNLELEGEEETLISDAIRENDVCDVFIILRQANTWSPLFITFQVFQRFVAVCQPFAPLLDYVQAFGYREDDDQRMRSGYHWKIATEGQDDEICYNIRFVEPHGRPEPNPWSLRQFGIYERVDIEKRTSMWMLIQPSDDVLQRVEDGLRWQLSSVPNPVDRSMRMHAAIIFAGSRHWADYLDDLQSRLESLEVKACCSTVGRPTRMDFSVEFRDCQTLQFLRRELFRTRDILTSNLQVITGCQLRCRKFAQLYDIPLGSTVLADLESQNRDLKSYRAVINRMLEYSLGTASLLGRILEFRHNESMRTQTQALTQLSKDQNASAEQTAQVQVAMSNDSRLLKALTVLATLYLPASLVAAIFSSNLVKEQSSDSSNTNPHLVLVHDFWIYIATTVPLVFLTLVFIWWIAKRPKSLELKRWKTA